MNGTIGNEEEKTAFEGIGPKETGTPPAPAAETAEGRANGAAASEIDAEPTDAELLAWEEMLEAYPDADAPEKLPKGVLEAVAKGKTPLLAMHEAEIARLRGVIAAYEQKERAAKSCGSVLGTAGHAVDPVLEILLGE